MCHNVFHVRLLEPFEDITIFGRVQSPPPPKELEGQEEHEVEAILDSKFSTQCRPFTIYSTKSTSPYSSPPHFRSVGSALSGCVLDSACGNLHRTSTRTTAVFACTAHLSLQSSLKAGLSSFDQTVHSALLGAATRSQRQGRCCTFCVVK